MSKSKKPAARAIRSSTSAIRTPHSAFDCIRLRGVRQNNLKGFDLDIPLGKYIAVTGLSGAGKSSLVFDTLHAEGQRRYVETFSAYTRQFLDLLDKPKVDSIENIRPSIAIEQTNTVKTSRSTVGTMTELTDYFKVWFSHVAKCHDPETGELIEADTPQTIWAKTLAAAKGQTLIVTFRVKKPANITWPEILTSLKNQTYVRVLIPDRKRACASARVDDLLANPKQIPDTAAEIHVVQDRIEITDTNRARFLEAAEAALHFGHGQLQLFAAASHHSAIHTPHSAFSSTLHNPATNRTFRPATPALFSFNSPLGACPVCRGFGRVIEIDYRLAIPDQSLSIEGGAITAFAGQVYSMSREDLIRAARRHKIPTNIPYAQLTEKQREFVMLGEPEYRKRKARGEQIDYETDDLWYGLKGFFEWLENNTYKMHVRVFLSRFRAYNPCPACHGQRLQPDALCWKWQDRAIPELYTLPVSELLPLVEKSTLSDSATSLETHSAKLARDSILTRLRYLVHVGLGYLTLDRPSKTLSGGEVERVNLTSCLGTSLVDTLFVLDEPSVGLHPRDIDRLIAIIRSLTDAGNTVVVVEHDETMIRAADHIIEVGPEPGAQGGHIVFSGPLQKLLTHKTSITGRYLSGRETIPAPQTRRPVESGQNTRGQSARDQKARGQKSRKTAPKSSASASSSGSLASGLLASDFLSIEGASKHNIRDLSLSVPLNRLVCLSGVSGSGKSTLLDNIIHQGILVSRHLLAEDPAEIARITGVDAFGEIILVDQSPLSRTPRSNPALYSEAWEHIRDLYASTPAAQTAGFTASSFSFNSGDGRCDHCNGLGSERVEMQFLSDVYVPCPICEGRRFKPEVLAITWRDRSIHDLLNTSIDDAIALFVDHPQITTRLAPLAQVGLGYLTLGQPLNTLSGGESQRLKLVRHLSGTNSNATATSSEISNLKSEIPKGALLLLDEPTTGLHRHDVKRLLAVLHALVDRGHSVIVIEHNIDVLKSADWIIEIGPEAGAGGGRIVAEGTPEHLAQTKTETAPYLLAALANSKIQNPKFQKNLKSPKSKSQKKPTSLPAGDSRSFASIRGSSPASLNITGARENNLKNLSLAIPHHALNVVTGVSGSGKSTLAFDIVFAEGQRRFMESMSPYARQFVEQLPRPDIDLLTGIPPTVAIEQRITRGSRKSTVATITEVAQYLRLLYARLGVQHHPGTGLPIVPLTLAQLRAHLAKILATDPRAKKAKKLYLCAPLIRGRKGHHQPIATWIEKQGHTHMRTDGRLFPVEKFEKLDRYKEHNIEVVVADLKSATTTSKSEKRRVKNETQTTQPIQRPHHSPASDFHPSPFTLHSSLDEALRLGQGSCFLLTDDNKIITWLSTTRTDSATGETFPELDPKDFSINSPRGWCPACRGHGRIYPWMLALDKQQNDTQENRDIALQLRAYGISDSDDISDHGQPCPGCHGERLNRIARAVKLHFTARNSELRMVKSEKKTAQSKKTTRFPKSDFHSSPFTLHHSSLSLPALLRLTPGALLAQLRQLDQTDARTRAITQDILPQIEERLRFLDHVGLGYLTLDRPTETLSGGESQRIRLAAQLGSNLSGVLYVLDEPSIGLHARDNDRLIETLETLRAKGNTLLVVEHDDELMRHADRIIDLGPAAGIHGGELLASGTPEEIRKTPASITGVFLKKGIKHPLRGAYRPLPA